jgi:hypothetical protein
MRRGSYVKGLIKATLVGHRETREIFMRNRCNVSIRGTQMIRKT